MFRDREDAGDRLGEALRAYRDMDTVVLAIPRGGVSVGHRVARTLQAGFDLLVVRKVAIPWEPEAGFASVGPDGSLHVNEDLVARLGLSEAEVRRLADEVRAEVAERQRRLRGDRPLPRLHDRPVLLVDDGLATGYTMLAAGEWVRRRGPRDLLVAAPCASVSALDTIKRVADTVVVLEVGRGPVFAVASFYQEWTDLTDADVLPYLKGAAEGG